MALITFAYSDIPAHDYDLAAALADKSFPATIFQVDNITPSGIGYLGETFTTKLLDNQKWQLKANRRKTQTLSTAQTINLTGTTFKTGRYRGLTISHKQLLTEWYYARSRWIDCGVFGLRTTDTKTDNLIKVIRTDDGLESQLDNAILYLEKFTIKLETAGSFV